MPVLSMFSVGLVLKHEIEKKKTTHIHVHVCTPKIVHVLYLLKYNGFVLLYLLKIGIFLLQYKENAHIIKNFIDVQNKKIVLFFC